MTIPHAGWKNRETWQANLHIENTVSLFVRRKIMFSKIAKRTCFRTVTAADVELFFVQNLPNGIPLIEMKKEDFVLIDWLEMAQSWNCDFKEYLEAEKNK